MNATRTLLVVIAASFAPAYAFGDDPRADALAELQGEWKVLEIEFGEHVTPDGDPKQWLVILKGDQLVVNTSGKAGTSDPVTVKLEPATKPKAIDFETGLVIGTVAGIYALENGQLRLCIGISNRPKEFVCPKEYGVLLILKRVKKQ